MSNLPELMHQLEKKENFWSAKDGANKSRYEVLEEKLGVVLPSSYKSFVNTWGFAIWFGHRICGVAEFAECDAVNFTMKFRKACKRAPKDGLVIAPYEAGGYYFLYCEGSSRVGEVVLFEDRALSKVAELWSSFEDFVKYLLKVTP